MIDLGNQIERGRLHKAIQTSRDVMEPFRRARSEFIRDHAGSWYSEGGARFHTNINKMNQTALIMTFALAAENPRFKACTDNQKLVPFARHLQSNMNKLVSNINLKQSLRLMVLDAFFLVGIAKVRMSDAFPIQLEDDVWVEAGQPWVDRISFDDAILDLTARDLTKMRFMGDRYRCSWEKVKKRDDFDNSVVKIMTPDSKYRYDTSIDYANQIANLMACDDDELEPMVWLEDVFIVENNQWATFPANPGYENSKPLKVVDWEGTKRGPYKFLGLGNVPDNVIPSSPAQNLKPLHDAINMVFRKVLDQARIAKQVVGYREGESQRADNYRTCKNGTWLPFNNPADIQTITIGGVDMNLNQFNAMMDEIYNAQSGNLRSLAGLGQEGNTLGQEELIQGRASQVISKMGVNVIEFTAEIGEELKHLLWQDDTFYQENWQQADPSNKESWVSSHWDPAYREGVPDNFTLSVEPYSMRYVSPQEKVAQIDAVLQKIAPLWPMFQQSGYVIDVSELLECYSDLLDRPELKRIIKQNPQGGDAPQGGDQNTVKSPAVTTRNVVRKNVSGGGGRGQLMNSILQGAPSGVPAGQPG